MLALPRLRAVLRQDDDNAAADPLGQGHRGRRVWVARASDARVYVILQFLPSSFPPSLPLSSISISLLIYRLCLHHLTTFPISIKKLLLNRHV